MPDKRGFTIMEMLVSVVVMAVVMLGLAYGYIIVQQRNLQELLRQKGEETIQGIFEGMRSAELDDLTDQPASLPDMDLEDTQNLNAYCDPDDNDVPDDPACTGTFVFRKASAAGGGSIDYEVVYKLFETVSDAGVELEGTRTVIATVCWRYRDSLKYITRKTVIQEGGL
ncbi:MAG: prepilin-type N-terminal cleavage/methylation domain-containing protein [Deferribacterales bacterium]